MNENDIVWMIFVGVFLGNLGFEVVMSGCEFLAKMIRNYFERNI